MKKEIVNAALNSLNEAGKAYARLIREYSTVNHTPAANAKVRKYIKDIKEMAFTDLNNILKAEREALIKAAKIQPGTRDLSGEIKRNNELILMQSAINGANDDQLIELANKYANTEYEEDFKTMIQPKIKALSEDRTSTRAKSNELINNIMNALDKVPEAVAEEVAAIETINEDIRSLLFFNKNTLPVNVQANEEGHIIHGNCNIRSIEVDIANANENFNPLGISLEPLAVTEQFGTRSYKTVRYQFDWEEN